MEKQTEENCFERVDERPARPADQVLTVGSGGGGAGSGVQKTGFVRAARHRLLPVGGWTSAREEFKLFSDKLTDEPVMRHCQGVWGRRKDRRGERQGRWTWGKGKGGGCLRIGEWLNFMGVDRPHLLHEARQVINEGRNKPNEEVETSQLILGRLSSSQL